MRQFKIQPELLKSCAPAMSKEETRYYLQGVHIKKTDKETIYEATNGHILIRCTSFIDHESEVEEDDFDVIIPAALVKNLSTKSFLKGYEAEKLTWLDASIDGQTITVETPLGIVTHSLIDGTYPQTDKVIPKNNDSRKFQSKSIGFNTAYLSEISKSLKAVSGNCSAEIFMGEDNSEPSLFLPSIPLEESEWLAVIMPLRLGG